MTSAKVKCDCGLSVTIGNMNKHMSSKSHITKIENKNRKFNNYNMLKDSCNCCSICFATTIDAPYFLQDKQMCLCCDEILRGGQKRCKNCKQLVEISKMERPYLKKCKECASKRQAALLNCEICGLEIQYRNISKHNEKFH